MKDLLTILLGFFEGLGLIASPCIWPILPILLAGSLAGSKKRPLGVILGFTLCFALFAFFSRKLVLNFGIDLNIIRNLAYALLFLLGLILLFSGLGEKFSRLTQAFGNLPLGKFLQNHRKETFLSGFFLGGLIAIIWTPCAGPILAAIIVQTILQKTNLMSFLILIAFALGAVIPMYFITIYGITLRDRLSFFKTKAQLIRKILGAVILLSVGYLFYQEHVFTLAGKKSSSTVRTWTGLENGVWSPYKAPAIEGITAWINSPPLNLAALKGKVVLLDFWTYSCINCVRTLPYLKDWYNKYHDLGFVIIGIHTPEFDFEKNLANVKSAVNGYGIRYPVALDNQFITWQNYTNSYWPALYLINQEGKVVYSHFGEGDDEVTENNIRYLLGMHETLKPLQAESSYSLLQTDETYLGYEKANIGLAPSLKQGTIYDYHFPETLTSNAWALQGSWLVHRDKIISEASNASLKIHFNARKVFIVMSNHSATPISVQVFLNGKETNKLLVNKAALYQAVDLPNFGSGILEILATEPGLEVYTFTFGG